MTTSPTTIEKPCHYRGYQLDPTWVSDHWVWRVHQNGVWIDSFLNPVDARNTIDDWMNAR